MLEFISAPEAAKKWGISERRVQKLCEENRIPGVAKFSRLWLILKDAEKPTDVRLKAERKKNMNKVLIIDDDKELCALMKKCVEQENLTAIVAGGGIEGLHVLEEIKDTCSLIILDIMMPDLDGFQVLQQVRHTSNVPVLMLTAKSGEEDKVSGLRMGADDYLTKPFSINELMARVNSLIRRFTLFNTVSGTETDCMVFQGMTIDNLNRLVLVNDIQVELTGKEFDLLSFLAANKGKVFTKKQIYTHVWEEEYAFDDSNIMSFISKLRKKIEPDPEHPFYILTVRGVGYRFNREA